MLAGPRPEVATGPHCTRPRECPFLERCWARAPEHHVSTLYRQQARALAALYEQGYQTIFDLPEDTALAATADRQRRAVQAGRMIVEPGLGRALRACASPVAFLDFETAGLPIPVWNGCHPWDRAAGAVELPPGGRRGWARASRLARGRARRRAPRAGASDSSPRASRARTIVAYQASFERECIRRIAAGAPALAPRLERIAERLVDLLPIVREHVYHPAFGGSFSLKRVLPALVPGLGYDDLAIGDGALASVMLERLLWGGEALGHDERARLREDLLGYCERDTLGLARLLERLRSLAGD